jgi:hypothetical protein
VIIARRIAIVLLVIVVLLVAQRQLRGPIRSWYANTFYTRIAVDIATTQPDHILLTWNDDPSTTQAVNWRTASSVTGGWVEYYPAGGSTEQAERVEASHGVLEDSLLVNDPVVHRFTAVITGLEPATNYHYRVGTDQDTASDWLAFTTAPAGSEPFSFIYMGDVQNEIGDWGHLLQASWERHPEAAFYLLAGDLVNEGRWRNEWDELFGGSVGVFDRVPLMPCIGNHDVDPALRATNYLLAFNLPENGPAGMEPQRAYHFEYGNALFVILDSMHPPQEQSAWLDEVLAASEHTWKIAMFHHPVYSSSHRRDNPTIRREWAPILEARGVHLVLQGHDHAYLRTHPLRDGEMVEDGGTTYIITVAGGKYYSTQHEYDFTAAAFPDTSTYQIIDIDTAPDRLTYRAFDLEGTLLDEFTLTP